MDHNWTSSNLGHGNMMCTRCSITDLEAIALGRYHVCGVVSASAPSNTLRMVVGFMFWHTNILLVQKNKPEWQAKLWNGVGGKVEPGESDEDAMVREFAEETGIKTAKEDWTKFCGELGPPDYHAVFFKMRVGALPPAPMHNDVGEALAWFTVRSLDKNNLVGNLRWLIPLAQDWRKHEPVTMRVSDDLRERATW